MKMKNKNLFGISLISFFLLSFISQSCEFNDIGAKDSSGEGTGGSMARFTIVADHLFTVDHTNLKVFDISQPDNPEFKKDKPVGFEVETIFPIGNTLFLGTSSGMYIYDVSTHTSPIEISFYEHIVSCDPVVSDGDYAYVTLSNLSERCWRAVNELHIIDLANLQSPTLVKQYEMIGPRGLAIRQDTLWVCDDGLKVFDVSDKTNIEELFHFDDIVAYDIILDKDRALVIGETGFVQYKMEGDSLRKLSEINVGL